MNYEEMMAQQGNESTLQAELGSSAAYKKRASELYNQLDQINQQYGQAAILPDRIVDKIHMLHSHLENTLNEWEQHKNRARTETRNYDTALEQQRGLGAKGQQLNSAPTAPAQFNEPIENRMDNFSKGIKSNAPPRIGQRNIPVPSVTPRQPGGSTPQFGHGAGYAKRFGIQQ